MSTLTGRYQFKPTLLGQVVLLVEEHSERGFIWRSACPADLPFLEPAVADGWRYVEERTGVLSTDGK